MVELYQLAKFGVVGLGVRVEHVLRTSSVRGEVAEVVEHHVAVEHPSGVFKTVFGEAVVVVPRPHLFNHSLHVAMRRQHAHLFIIIEHGAHVVGGEAQHLVEGGVRREVPPDVEAAGKVVEGHWTDAGEEDTVEVSLELLEQVTIEAVGMGYGMIHRLALFVKHNVGEVVVFVDDEEQRNAQFLGITGYQHQLVGCVLRFKVVFYKIFRVVVSVAPYKAVEATPDILIAFVGQLVN